MRGRLPTCLALVMILGACSPSSGTGGTGGATGTGTGGASAGTGGSATGSGGSNGSGGSATASGGSGTGGSVGQSGGATGTGTGGGNSATGGSAAGTGGTSAATGGTSAGTGGGATGTGGAGGATATTGLSIVASWPNGAILSGVRGVSSPALTQALKIKNGGSSAVMVTALTLGGTNKGAFQLNGAPSLPASIAAGAELSVTVQAMTSGSALPAAGAQDDGATLLTATLAATAGTETAMANLYGIILNQATHECTLGQILTTLGYKLNVGMAQNNANPNSGGTSTLPKVESGTDEIAAPLFKKGPSGMPTVLPVARYSPKGPMPFGWYPMGNGNTRNKVGEMASMTDAQTSDKARMVLPPITGMTTFDPGTATFGIWVYTDQASKLYESGGNAANGDYNYTEDALNLPANTHRTKVYPLKDAAGKVVANSYLLAVEEAANGDYQDFVFVLSNVTVAQ